MKHEPLDRFESTLRRKLREPVDTPDLSGEIMSHLPALQARSVRPFRWKLALCTACGAIGLAIGLHLWLTRPQVDRPVHLVAVHRHQEKPVRTWSTQVPKPMVQEQPLQRSAPTPAKIHQRQIKPKPAQPAPMQQRQPEIVARKVDEPTIVRITERVTPAGENKYRSVTVAMVQVGDRIAEHKVEERIVTITPPDPEAANLQRPAQSTM